MVLPIYRAWVVLASLTVCGMTWLLIERTRLGAMLRAATENARLVQAFGINVPLHGDDDLWRGRGARCARGRARGTRDPGQP